MVSNDQAVDLRNMISRSNLIYKTDMIANRQSIYKPGDFIELHIPNGDYLANVAKTKLFYRPVIKQDLTAGTLTAKLNRGLKMNSAKSAFHIQSIRMDSKMTTPGQGERSRPIFNALKERMTDVDKQRNDILSGVNTVKEFGFDYVVETQANISNLTNARGADLQGKGHDIDVTLQTARQNYRKQIQMLNRFYAFTPQAANNRGSNLGALQNMDTTNDVVTRKTDDPQERYTWLEVDLGDLSIELQTMTMVYMGNFTNGITITLQLLLPQYCMSITVPPPVGTQSTQAFWQPATDRYLITDVCMLLRKHDLNPEGNSIMRQISIQNPVPFITYQYQQRSLENGDTFTLTDTTTLEASSYLGTLICFTSNGARNQVTYGDAAAENAAFDYQNTTAYNNANFEYDSTHFYLSYTRAEIDVDNQLYKANPLPIGDRSYASYLQAMDGFNVLFQGKMYDVPFREFIDKAFCIAIPVNTQGLVGLNTKGKRITLSIEFSGTDGKSANRSNYQAHIFHLITASMKVDPQAGISIEK